MSPVLAVDVRRVLRRTLILSLVVLAAITLYKRAGWGQLGLDFHGGAWRAALAMLHGRSPYPPADPRLLYALKNAFVTPPATGWLAAPLTVLPFRVGMVVWNALDAAAFAGALFLLGVRDVRLYLLALCSFAFVDSLVFGQPEGLYALLAAVAWRYRDDTCGPVALGALIAAKLIAWPLVLWLLATRRYRGAAVAAGSAAAILAASWAPIGFAGLARYPALLSADAHAFEQSSYSGAVLNIARQFGAPQSLAIALAFLVAACVAGAMIRATRGSDRGLFAAATIFALLISPVLWPHYLVAVFVPLAVLCPRLDRAWRLTALFWIALVAAYPLAIITAAVGLAMVRRSR